MTRAWSGAVIVTIASAVAGGSGAWAQGRNDAAVVSPAASAASAPAVKRAVLIVLAGNKPVAQAAVKLQVGDGPEITATTNEDGEASLALAAASIVHVRVIATGWATFMDDLNLAPGKRTEVKLKANP